MSVFAIFTTVFAMFTTPPAGIGKPPAKPPADGPAANTRSKSPMGPSAAARKVAAKVNKLPAATSFFAPLAGGTSTRSLINLNADSGDEGGTLETDTVPADTTFLANKTTILKDNNDEDDKDNDNDGSITDSPEEDAADDALVRKLRKGISGILDGIQNKIQTNQQLTTGTLSGQLYPLTNELQKANFNSDAIEAIIAGLVLLVATNDYSSLDEVPVTLRSGATNLLLSLLPKFLPNTDVGRAELETSGVTHDMLRQATNKFPIYLLLRLITALTTRLGDSLYHIPDESGSVHAMKSVILDLKLMLHGQRSFVTQFIGLWRTLERQHSHNKTNTAQVNREYGMDSQFRNMVREMAHSFLPGEAAKIVNSLAHLREMLKDHEIELSDDIYAFDKAIANLGLTLNQITEFDKKTKNEDKVRKYKVKVLMDDPNELNIDTIKHMKKRRDHSFVYDPTNLTRTTTMVEDPIAAPFDNLSLKTRLKGHSLPHKPPASDSTRIPGHSTNFAKFADISSIGLGGSGGFGEPNDGDGSPNRRGGYGDSGYHGGGNGNTGGRSGGAGGGGGNAPGGRKPPGDSEPSDSSSSSSSTDSDDDEVTRRRKRKARKRRQKKQAKRAERRLREMEDRLRRSERNNKGRAGKPDKRPKKKDSDSDSSDSATKRNNTTTTDSLLKAYAGKAPIGGFGAGSLPEQEAAKGGYYGNELNLEIHRSWQKTHENAGPGILTAKANQSIALMNTATKMAQKDISHATEDEKFEFLQSRLNVMTAALSPESLRMLATGGAIDNKELGLGLQSSYIRVPPPTLGTKRYDVRDKKKVESVIGEKWSGRSVEQGDVCDALDFFTVIASTIQGRLNAEAALTLIRVCCRGPVRMTLKNIPDNRAFGHVWTTLTAMHHSSTDFLDIRRKKLKIMEVKPTNIGYTINKIVGLNKVEVLRFPQSERDALLISQTRADLLYIVTTHFPEQHDHIVLPDRRHGQRWADERMSARRNGYDPDELSYDYDPILSLATLIIERLEMIYGPSVKQPVSRESEAGKKPEAPRRGFKVGSIDIAAIGEALVKAAATKPQKADSDASTGESDHDPRFEDLLAAEEPETGKVSAISQGATRHPAKRDKQPQDGNKGPPKGSGDDLPVYACGLCGAGYHGYTTCTVYPEGKSMMGRTRRSCCGGYHLGDCRKTFRLDSNRTIRT